MADSFFFGPLNENMVREIVKQQMFSASLLSTVAEEQLRADTLTGKREIPCNNRLPSTELLGGFIHICIEDLLFAELGLGFAAGWLCPSRLVSAAEAVQVVVRVATQEIAQLLPFAIIESRVFCEV